MASVQISFDPAPECQTMALEHDSLSPGRKWETSSRHVDSSNMHTFYQRYLSEHRWTKDHPIEQVIGNPSQSVRTRRQLESNAEMCMFALTGPLKEEVYVNQPDGFVDPYHPDKVYQL
nr:putative RNA-directed DNA polymerase [Tanacetum cinerariifolium]